MAYLDAASGEHLHPAARDALLAAYERGWADPSRLYSGARRARALLDQARVIVADSIGARPDEINFTASGTAANHLAVLGVVGGRARARDASHVVASAIEHSSILRAAHWHEARGGTFATVPVDRLGRVSELGVSAALLEARTALVCVQSANHEVGTTQPITRIAATCAEAGVPLLVDAAQSVGRASALPDGWSVLTASAHKWGGPPGVGVLAVRPDAGWRTPFPGDDRESGRVPGFENVPAIVAAAAALEAVRAEADREDARLRALVDRIRTAIPHLVPDVELVGDPIDRLPHIVTFSCLYVDGEALVTALDREGFAINSGSSCTSSTLEPSHVLVAMGALSHGNVRVSLPRGTSETDVDRFLDSMPRIVAALRSDSGVAGL